MALAAAGARCGVIPASCAAYDAVWAYLMPLAAALYLLEADLRQLVSTARPALAAFVVGAAGTVLGTFTAFAAVGHLLGPEGFKIGAALCASYVGGAVNFAATAAALGLSQRRLLAVCMAADNICMAAYLGAVMSVPARNVAGGESGRKGAEQGAERAAPSVESLALALAVAAAACAAGGYLAGSLLRLPAAGMAMTALLCSGAALAVPRGTFAGAEALAGALMLAFFGVIGAAAGLSGGMPELPALLAFIGLQLGVHLAVQLGVGRLLRLPMQVLLIASNANVGGPGTAAAMAAARAWPAMIMPAMMTGSLGYAVGTLLGCSVAQGLRAMAPA